MIKQYRLFIALFCCQSFFLQAQDMSLYFMNGIAQSTAVNPSFLPDRKLVFCLPGFNLGASNSIGSYNSMLTQNAEGNTLLNTAGLLQQSQAHNFVRAHAGLTTFDLIMGMGNWRFSVSNTLRQNTFFAYPKGLVELAAEGNAAHLGETLEIGPDMNVELFGETAIGFMMNLGKINVGGRIKLLSGIANISTSRTKASLTTDEEYYQLQVNSDYQINSGGLISVEGLAGEGEVAINFNDKEFGMGSMFKNPNLGLDLGANMTLLNDKLMLSASIIDLGQIKWRNNAKNYRAQGSFNFEGVDLNGALEEGGDDFGKALLDSLENTFDFTETENSYKTMLPTRVYMSARYKAHRLLTAGVLAYVEPYRGQIYNGLAIDATTHVGKIVDVGLTGSYVYRSANLGAHLVLKFGPVQIIAASDNVLALIKPQDHKYTTARFGMNLAFGKKFVGDTPTEVK
jgi:Family of unknown function (DUF5723)